MTRPIRIFILDDHALFREGLLRLLESDSHLKVAGSAGSIPDTIRMLAQVEVDVLILDYDLGEQTGLVLVRHLRKTNFRGRILIVTAGLPDRDAVELVRLGISGIFPKHHSPEMLHRCILDVAEGNMFIEQKYFQSLVENASTAGNTGPRLTQRDREILRLLLEGFSNKEIAAALQISESAVKASLQQLFAKTGVRTRSQLVRIALEQLRDQL